MHYYVLNQFTKNSEAQDFHFLDFFLIRIIVFVGKKMDSIGVGRISIEQSNSDVSPL